MSDLNTTTSTEVKAKAEPTTAKHARFLAEASRKRADKFTAQADEARAAAVRYDELALTLPESNPASSTAKARPVIEPGTQVSFRFGRTTATSKSKVLDGVVKARKDKDGKPEAYKIAVGEGFDETLYTVAPGAILLAGESADENEADEQNEGGVAAGL